MFYPPSLRSHDCVSLDAIIDTLIMYSFETGALTWYVLPLYLHLPQDIVSYSGTRGTMVILTTPSAGAVLER